MGKMAWIDGALHLLIDGRWMHHETVENAIADKPVHEHPEVEEGLIQCADDFDKGMESLHTELGVKLGHSDGWFVYQKLRKAGWQLCPSTGLTVARIEPANSIPRMILGNLKKIFARP